MGPIRWFLSFLKKYRGRYLFGLFLVIVTSILVLINPKILILDEATSSIDTETEILLQKGLQELLKGRMSFIIAHRLSTIRSSSCIMYIDQGTFLSAAPMRSLWKSAVRTTSFTQASTPSWRSETYSVFPPSFPPPEKGFSTQIERAIIAITTAVIMISVNIIHLPFGIRLRSR